MNERTEQVISLQEVSVKQQNQVVLEDVFIDISEGEFVYLIGPTGSGKSTFLRLLYADLELHSGDAVVAGFSLNSLKNRDIPFLRRKLGIIFQEFELLTDRTVKSNLEFVLKATGWKNKDEIANRIEEVLTQVKLINKEDFYPLQLSGGEQQRVAIARALLNKPKIILADEPTGNLDPGVSNEILQLFIDINQREHTSIIMATHHHNFLKKYPARVLKCEAGKIGSISKEKVTQSLEKLLGGKP